MGTTLSGPHPWPQITRALRTGGPRSVAIAYLGAHAPDLLPLRRGDLLLVNADRPALRAHATSPEALQHFCDRGVRVVSSPSLHAKVAATATVAVIGSANASHTSTGRDEAVVISDDPQIVQQVHDFVAGLVDPRTAHHTSEVGQAFLDWAKKEWDRGAPAALIGIDGDPGSTHEFLPSPVTRLFIEDSVDYELSPAEAALETRSRRQIRRDAPTAAYELMWWRDEPGRLRRDDVLLLRYADGDDGQWLSSPHVVFSDEYRIPNRRGSAGYFLRYRPDLAPIAVGEVAAALTAAGVSPSLAPRRIRSPHHREALLSLWAE